MKVCRKCKIEKDESEFSRDRTCKDGKRSICKNCRRQLNKKYYKENKVHIYKISREWADKNSEKVKYLKNVNNKRKSKNLADSYVKTIIRNYTKMPHRIISAETVEMYRLYLLVKRKMTQSA